MVTQSPTLTPKAMPRHAGSQRIPSNDRADLAYRVFLHGPAGFLLAIGTGLLVTLIGVLDFYTGPDLSFTIFYLAPIALAAWWGGFAHGILMALACAVSWHLVDLAEDTVLPAVLLWNGTARFGVFIITASLLSRLRVSLYLEKNLARSDPLTGAANGRTFYENVSLAVERALRSQKPMTLAYLDLDNFKWLNDKLGHSAGDEVLCDLVRCVQKDIRVTDLFARLGGDEFALLLPDCGADDAKVILECIHKHFIREMAQKTWPVTLSVGAMTFPQPLRDVDALVRRVDGLMYQAKKAGKNRIVHLVLRDSELEVEIAEGKIHERRATARVLCDQPAKIRAEGDNDGFDEFARVRDISPTGLCLHLERQLAENTLLAVEPLHETGAKTLLVRMLWAARDGNGWMHECVLPNRLSSEELKLWVKEQPAESFHDCHQIP